MDKLYRILDANINRASEGLRVLEDLARFYFDDLHFSKRLKELRHNIRKNLMDMMPMLLEGRNSATDVGVRVSMELQIDKKASV
ncbi:MAG TPA: thiamine phosphate synthase, partial [Acetivibrio sp.]|nr:thiamine phosphate synthase [Acetivibrio sp.]